MCVCVCALTGVHCIRVPFACVWRRARAGAAWEIFIVRLSTNTAQRSAKRQPLGPAEYEEIHKF